MFVIGAIGEKWENDIILAIETCTTLIIDDDIKKPLWRRIVKCRFRRPTWIKVLKAFFVDEKGGMFSSFVGKHF